jgi:hypothetical protein
MIGFIIYNKVTYPDEYTVTFGWDVSSMHAK